MIGREVRAGGSFSAVYVMRSDYGLRVSQSSAHSSLRYSAISRQHLYDFEFNVPILTDILDALKFSIVSSRYSRFRSEHSCFF